MNHWPILLAITLLVPAWRQALPPQTAAPSLDLPNPYRTIERWGTLPAGRTWGGVTAVDIDRDGRSVWVLERCGGMSCAESTLAPILKLDASGAVVASFRRRHVRRRARTARRSGREYLGDRCV